MMSRASAPGWTDLGNVLHVLATVAENRIEPDWLRTLRGSRGQAARDNPTRRSTYTELR